MPEKSTQPVPRTEDRLRQASQILEEVKRSGYIPFASPCPSSTEKLIKKHIEDAIMSIETAIIVHKSIFH